MVRIRVTRVLCASAVLALGACGGSVPETPVSTPAPGPLLELTFDDPENPVSTGSAEVTVEVVAMAGGGLRSATGPDGGSAAGFPRFEQSGRVDPVAVVVRPGQDDDPLSPGRAAFRFGADVRLDRESQGSAVDDGNNVVQRGLFGGAQYKIQVDRGVISCRVAGSGGAVFVEDREPIRPEEWYRIECSRAGTEVTLVAEALEREGERRVTVHRGPTGVVSMQGGSVPLSIGCKVKGGGVPVAGSTDQFNGAIDNVFFDVG